MANFSQLITEVKARSGITGNEIDTSIKLWINDVLRELSNNMFSCQLKQDTFLTSPLVEFTVDTLNGSDVIDGIGADISFLGYNAVFGSDTTIYKIIEVDVAGDRLYLNQNYIDESTTGVTLKLFKQDYVMPWDIIGIEALSINGNKLEKIARLPYLREGINISTGIPTRWCEIGFLKDRTHHQAPEKYVRGLYSTGTISADGSITVSGTGIGNSGNDWELYANYWIQADSQGIPFKIVSGGGSVITLVKEGMLCTSDTYKIGIGDNIIIRLDSAPDGGYDYSGYIVDRWSYRRFEPLVNDDDVPDVPYDMQNIVIAGAYYKVLQHTREFNEALIMAKTEYEEAIHKARVSDDKARLRARTNQMRTGYEEDITGSWV